jgi:Raf kinase inhibitor-like YbhB/YbcL family protein
MQLLVDSFGEGAPIPKQYTCEGGDTSPEIRWSGASDAAKSFVLIVDDPDAPSGTWVHWVQFDIPGSAHDLPERTGARVGISGTNSFGKQGYGGPCPPKGHGPHRYYFRLYALKTDKLGLKPGAKREDVDRAMKPHIIAQAEYMGRYERR